MIPLISDRSMEEFILYEIAWTSSAQNMMMICRRGFILRGLFMLDDGPEANIDCPLYKSRLSDGILDSDTDDTLAGLFVTALVSLPAQ
jgi:hypothetical protein